MDPTATLRLNPATGTTFRVAEKNVRDLRVTYRPVQKLFGWQLSFAIRVSVSRYHLRLLLWRTEFIFGRRIRRRREHLAKGRNFLHYLVLEDEAISVQVIHAEGPSEPLLQRPAINRGQYAHELEEIDAAVPFNVEGAEDVLGKLLRVFLGKLLFTFVNISREICPLWNSFLKTRYHSANFSWLKLVQLLQIFQKLWASACSVSFPWFTDALNPCFISAANRKSNKRVMEGSSRP